MNLIERAKNIITTPKTEWLVIDNEIADPKSIITGYVIPLATVAAIAAFIGYGLIGTNMLGIKVSGINWGLYKALTILVSAIVGVLLSAFVIDALAPTFKSEKNFNKSIQLAAFAYTPAWVGGILNVLPSLAFIGGLFGLYGLYLLYIGLPIMKKTPDEQKTPYFIVSLLVMIAVMVVAMAIVGAVFMNIFGLSTPTVDASELLKNFR
ncbi:MAG: DUF1282 domain-containing protein [Bacteroidia bacterium]|nr:MAG: DUF1282 domain-containing protein [Bacteroidia bacterium]